MSDMGTDQAGSLAVEVYKRVGELVTVFQSLAADDGMPLTEVQAALLCAVATQTFDGLEAALATQLSVEACLRTGMLADLLNPQPQPETET